MARSEISKADLLAQLRASKRPVTARQLERWSKADHMDRPERRHIPGVRGSVSMFSARAFSQAAALYDAGNIERSGSVADRRLDERSFIMWWSGKSVTYDPRELILKFSAPMMDAIDSARIHQTIRVGVGDASDAEDTTFDAVEAHFSQYPPERFHAQVFKTFFANLGKRRNDFQSVMTTMGAAALGVMPLLEASHNDTESSLAALVLKAFGFDQFQSNVSPETDVQGVLRNVSVFADRKSISDFVRALGDEELDMARKVARVYIEDLPEIFEIQSKLFGNHSFARILRSFAHMATAQLKAIAVVGAVWILRQEGSTNALAFVEQIRKIVPQARALRTLVQAFPEYKKLLAHNDTERLAALPEETRQKMLAILKPAMEQ